MSFSRLYSRNPIICVLFVICFASLSTGFDSYAAVSASTGFDSCAAVSADNVADADRVADQDGSDTGQVSDEMVEKILAAMPERAPGTPLQPRKLLVFSLCKGFAHGVIPTVERALTIMGHKTGAFEVVISSEMDAFTAENLAQFDAVLFNNTTQLTFENSAYRRALIDFVKGGKGVIGLHAATDNFYDWPEAAEMMGGLFDGHPWTAGGTWAVKLDEPDHPLNKPFESRAFLIKDEIYQITGPYSRDTHRVLLSLDMIGSRNHQVEGIKREDNDFAISWIRSFGEGRVFYCSLGHNHEVLWNGAVLGHYLAGIQYALGDLEVDDTPSNSLEVKPRPATISDAGTLDDSFAALVAYDFSRSRAPLAAIEAMIRNSMPADHQDIEVRLVEVLDNPESTFAARQFVCRMLRRIEPKLALPHLSRLLLDERLSDAARLALQGHESPEIDRILRGALDELDGELLIGLIGTLGQRRDRLAVPQIAALISADDTELTGACVTVLGEIGGSEAMAALEKMQIPAGLELLRFDALLRCADRLLDDGAESDAQAVYLKMSSDEFPVTVRIAAYRGLVLIQGEEAIQTLMAMLGNREEAIQSAAVRFMVEMQDSLDRASIQNRLSEFPVSTRIAVLTALETDLSPLLELLERAPDREDRIKLEIAILAACKRMGDQETGVDRLLATLQGKTVAVRVSIYYVLGKLLSDKSLAALSSATSDESAEVRIVAIGALGDWPVATPLETLLGIARESGSEEEHLLALTGALRLAGLPGERTPDEDEILFRLIYGLARSGEEKAMVLEELEGVAELWVLEFVTPLLQDETVSEKAEEVREGIIESLAKSVSHDAAGCPVTLTFPYKEQYSGGGKEALTDGEWGSSNFDDGRWQGFEGEDLEAVIDLGREIEIHSIRAGFLQDNPSWIFLPSQVTYSLSRDGVNFETAAAVEWPLPEDMGPITTRTFYAELTDTTARFVRVIAKNIGTLPECHPGSPVGLPWLFADEIQINPHFQRMEPEYP